MMGGHPSSTLAFGVKKIIFGDLGHLYICELCFPVFYSLFEFLFSILLIFLKLFVLYWSITG